MIIYKFTNKLNGKIYIGQTTLTLKKRSSQHYSAKDEVYFHRALKKYGKENFTEEEICSATNLDDLNRLEEHFIQYYGSLRPNGYNIILGGNNFKRVCSPMQGRRHSEETKKKMSLAALGKPKNPESIRKMAITKTGTKASKETRDKMSKARVGMKYATNEVVCNETGEKFISVLEASRKTGIYRNKIIRQLTGKTKKTKSSLTFSYINREK